VRDKSRTRERLFEHRKQFRQSRKQRKDSCQAHHEKGLSKLLEAKHGKLTVNGADIAKESATLVRGQGSKMEVILTMKDNTNFSFPSTGREAMPYIRGGLGALIAMRMPALDM